METENQKSQPPQPSVRLKILTVSREVGTISKTGENPHFKSSYAKLDDILNALTPVMEKNKLGIEFDHAPEREGQEGLIATVFDEESSDTKTYTKYLPLSRPDAQAVGSADTYLRRYLLILIFNLNTVDDDGNEASGHTVAQKQSPPVAYAARPAAETKPTAPAATQPFSEASKKMALDIARTAGFDEAIVDRWMKVDPTNRTYVNIIAAPTRFVDAMTAFRDQETFK